MNIPQALGLALQHHRAGHLTEAEALYRQILAVQPNHAEAWQFLGVIAHQVGRQELAVKWIQQAIALAPHHSGAYSNLGEAYRAMGRADEAITAFHRALELKPDAADVLNNLGNALRDKGQFGEAITALRRALEINPGLAETWNNLATALAEEKQFDEAMAAYRRAVHLKPDYLEAWNNLGLVLKDLGRLDEAIVVCRHVLQLKPDYAEGFKNLASALRNRGYLEEAVAAYQRALQLSPDYLEAHNDLGIALTEQGRLDKAIAAYGRAIQLDPDYTKAHSNLGLALALKGRFDEAVAAYVRALEIDPGYAEVRNNLGNALRDQGRMDEAVAAYRRALELQPGRPSVLSNLIYALLFHPRGEEQGIAREYRRWNQQFGEPLKRFVASPNNDRDPDRRLRIGYVSPEFRSHVVGRNLAPLFRNRDATRYEIFCYSGVLRPDYLTAEFRQYADHWRNTIGMADGTLAEMIRADKVDILVDLTQHLAGNRLPVFARRLAPVQVSFAGYPEDTGLEAIEYRITDRYLEGELTGKVSEKSGQHLLIDSFWCYDPCEIEVEVGPLPAPTKGVVTFGSLNNFCKVNEPVLQLWARVLREVKDARLMLLSFAGSHRQHAQEILEREGVEARRVTFVEPCARQTYLELYHQIDIVLDPFPYNGHTTSLDALWMGVPVVSLVGLQSVSRAGFSQLSNLGLPGLAAFSEDDYVRSAAELARDLPRLAELRSTLRARMEASVLMDGKRFARGIESAFRSIWQTWCLSGKANSRDD